MRCIVLIRVNHLNASIGYDLKITEGWLRGLRQPHFGAVHESYRVGGSNPFPLRQKLRRRGGSPPTAPICQACRGRYRRTFRDRRIPPAGKIETARPAPRVRAARTGRLSLARSRGYGVEPANSSFLFKQWSRRRFQASNRRDFQESFSVLHSIPWPLGLS
jgi:hypothetical protein